MNLTHNELIAKGFVRQADGSYNKPVAGLQNPKREQAKVAALDCGSSGSQKRDQGFRYHIAIVSYRKREIDFSNLVSGAKAIQDEIAERLGIDDGDHRHTWQFEQIVSFGATGTHVLISTRL